MKLRSKKNTLYLNDVITPSPALFWLCDFGSIYKNFFTTSIRVDKKKYSERRNLNSSSICNNTVCIAAGCTFVYKQHSHTAKERQRESFDFHGENLIAFTLLTCYNQHLYNKCVVGCCTRCKRFAFTVNFDLIKITKQRNQYSYVASCRVSDIMFTLFHILRR